MESDLERAIRHQKEEAASLLQRINNPNAIVGGGCPRDWALGERGVDIDIFITRSPDIAQVRADLGVDLMEMGGKYEHSPFDAYNAYLPSGQEFQVLVVHEDIDPLEYVMKLPASLSQAAYDGADLHYSELFEISRKYRVCLVERDGVEGAVLHSKYGRRLPMSEWYVRSVDDLSDWKRPLLRGVAELQRRQQRMQQGVPTARVLEVNPAPVVEMFEEDLEGF